MRWEQRGQIDNALSIASDLVSTPSGLVISASRDPLEKNGAGVFRLKPDGKMETVLRWSGQGFDHVYAFDDVLIVPDIDAPWPLTDGYIFVSDQAGRMTRRSRELLQDVYHVFDVIRLPGGRMLATAGAYPQGGRAYISRPGPGALFIDAGPDRPWRRILEWPDHAAARTHRLKHGIALSERTVLLAVEQFRNVEPRGGAIIVDNLPDRPSVHPVSGLTSYVRRWIRWRNQIFAVTESHQLWVSANGGWSFVPTMQRLQGLVPTEEALYGLGMDGSVLKSIDGSIFEPISLQNPDLRPAHTIGAPMVVHRGTLWAASSRSGRVFELVMGSR